jgi:membrane fusion protein (multidrug efflux system)
LESGSVVRYRQELMKEAVYWAALPVVIAFASCQKPASTVGSGPPEVLVTEVIQKEVPMIRQWVGTLNGSENADVRARTTGYL